MVGISAGDIEEEVVWSCDDVIKSLPSQEKNQAPVKVEYPIKKDAKEEEETNNEGEVCLAILILLFSVIIICRILEITYKKKSYLKKFKIQG